MRLDSLYSRIAAAFALVLIAFGATLGWLAYAAAKHHQHQVMQQLSRNLARHIATREGLIGAHGVDRASVEKLFQMTTAVNPSIEIYLLDAEGRVLAHSPEGPLESQRVPLPPIHDFLAERALPILGESPRTAARTEVFSATPIARNGRTQGYLYILLLGDMYRQMAEDARRSYLTRTAIWVGLAALALALAGGLAAFAWITRPLNRLTRRVEAFEQGRPGDEAVASSSGGEIARLQAAFERMRRRLSTHVAELKRQDELRRELVANVSHDLRTPLTSMQNYLETLSRMGDGLSAEERQQYLEIAVRQSQRVGKLAQQLLELARLECEETLPETEAFSLSELVQDVGQKFALAAEQKGVRLVTDAAPDSMLVRGDIGMIERVITNLIDNAIRHTPSGGEVRLQAAHTPKGIEVRVADTGTGIAAEHLSGLLQRDSPLRQTSNRMHGLGLLIAHRILALHGASIDVASEPGRGTIFRFALPTPQ